MMMGHTISAQTQNREVGWDLSYEKLLDLNGVKWDHSQGTLFTWLKHRQEEHQFIMKFITGELEKKPEEMFVIDHPTFPSAGRITIIAVKNMAGCYFYYRSTDEKMRDFKRNQISTEMFDQIFDRLHTLKQRGYESMGGPEKAYAGFLSTTSGGEGHQVLLHIHDFLEFDAENQEILRVGRIAEIENSLQVNNNVSFNH
jgi:hypothetical protein